MFRHPAQETGRAHYVNDAGWVCGGTDLRGSGVYPMGFCAAVVEAYTAAYEDLPLPYHTHIPLTATETMSAFARVGFHGRRLSHAISLNTGRAFFTDEYIAKHIPNLQRKTDVARATI